MFLLLYNYKTNLVKRIFKKEKEVKQNEICINKLY
jgi:hypothetical protein